MQALPSTLCPASGPPLVHAPFTHAEFGWQVWQALPPEPQANPLLPGAQKPCTQQPVQLPGPHPVVPWHLPCWQVCPGWQATQNWPDTPHSAAVCWATGTQVVPARQQPLQFPGPQLPPATHLPNEQVLPLGQDWQTTPPNPQAASVMPGWQAPLASMQPPHVT